MELGFDLSLIYISVTRVHINLADLIISEGFSS